MSFITEKHKSPTEYIFTLSSQRNFVDVTPLHKREKMRKQDVRFKTCDSQQLLMISHKEAFIEMTYFFKKNSS